MFSAPIGPEIRARIDREASELDLVFGQMPETRRHAPVERTDDAASFQDYYMPRAGLIPEIRGAEHPTESKVSPLGVKGVGESGCTASIPVLVAAVIDAVRPLGIQHLDMPLTPARLWRAISDSAR